MPKPYNPDRITTHYADIAAAQLSARDLISSPVPPSMVAEVAIAFDLPCWAVRDASAALLTNAETLTP